jgi:hypothetical protein
MEYWSIGVLEYGANLELLSRPRGWRRFQGALFYQVTQCSNRCAILQYSKTPSLRSPEFEDSLPDVASQSFRRRGEVGTTKDENEARLTPAPFPGVVRPIGRRLA